MNIIQLNKLSQLHDGEYVFFCHMGFLDQDLQTIKNIKHDVILISGNSDLCITEQHLNKMPSNIKKWYAQNALVSHEKIRTLPLGIISSQKCKRENHGKVWDHAIGVDVILNKYMKVDKKPTKLIYSNFRCITDPTRTRNTIKNICINTDHITWEESNLSYEKYFDSILDHELVLCPQGNGQGDNHRIYEALYLNRIPITYNKKLYELLHHNYPVMCLDNIEQIKNSELITNKLNEIKSKDYNLEMLDVDYWVNDIKKELEDVKKRTLK